jgi:hypothetical protein
MHNDEESSYRGKAAPVAPLSASFWSIGRSVFIRLLFWVQKRLGAATMTIILQLLRLNQNTSTPHPIISR